MITFRCHSGLALSRWQDWATAQARSPRHWKAGRSAMLLAQAWGGSWGVPWRVRLALEQAPPLRGFVAEEGIVEHPTPMPGFGRPSMTDLAVVGRVGGQPVVLGVEGKVSEDFGPLVAPWLRAGSSPGSLANRTRRVHQLATTLGLSPALCGPLRYQLLHRTCAALALARSQGASVGMLLVHSFLPAEHPQNHWADFHAFASALGVSAPAPDRPARVGLRDGVELWVGWVSDAGGVC